MKILKSRHVSFAKELVEFVAENNISREDIIAITQAAGVGYTIFYYGLA